MIRRRPGVPRAFVRSSVLAVLLAAGLPAGLSPLPAISPALAQSAAPQNGGSMTIAFKDDIATLDPAIGYDWQNWSLIKSMFSGLMDYEPGTTQLRPMLANSYSISPDGLVYTFQLRRGVHFHNGRELTADDIVYSIQRTVNPKTQSPGASFFSAIAGFDDYTHGKADHLAGLAAPDPYTVKISLSHPSAPFLHVLALNFAFAVPREEVEKPGNDFGKHPVGTGAFQLKEWTLGQHVTLVRNPNYFEAGIPHLDQIVVQVGQEPMTALLRLQNGEVDALGDGIPPARFTQVMKDPKLKPDVVTGPRLETSYLAIKVDQKPFDDIRVRRALNHAINKQRIVRLINGRATPAKEVLPPGMPGYDPSYQGYEYDPAKAIALLKEAGYPNGFSTTIYSNNTDPNPRIVQAIQQDLAAIGIKADIKTVAQEALIAAASTSQAPIVWSGGTGWSDDFPDPTDFYTPILSCGSAKGGWNWSNYCRKDLDAAAVAADSITDPAKTAERLDAWAKIYAQVMDDAPWVPVFNEKLYVLKTPRLAGPRSLFVDPIYTPINYPYVWVSDAK